MSIDRFLDRQKAPDYWCGDLAREVWLDLTGNDLGAALADLLASDAVGRLRRRHVALFRELPAPVDPCIVIMQKPRTPLHMGVYVRGKVIHLKQRGVEFQPLETAARMFKRVRFYQC